MSQPGLLARPAAARRARAAGEARGARRGDQEERHSRARRSTGWRPGPRPSSCSATSSSDMGLKGGEGVEAVLRNSFHDQGQADRRARNQRRAARLLRHAARKGAARSCSKARSTPAARHDEGFQRDARGLVARRRQGDRPDLQPRSRRLARAREALIKRRNANWSQVDRAADGAARIGPDRGRRGPSRGQGFGDRAAQEATATRSAASSRPRRRRAQSVDKCSPFADFARHLLTSR